MFESEAIEEEDQFLISANSYLQGPNKICSWKRLDGHCDGSVEMETLSSWSAFYHQIRLEELEISDR